MPVEIMDRWLVEKSNEEAGRNRFEPTVEIMAAIAKKDSRTDNLEKPWNFRFMEIVQQWNVKVIQAN